MRIVVFFFVICGASCAGLEPDEHKIMAELSWNIKPQFLEYIYVKQNMSNISSRPIHVEGIQKARRLLKETLPKPPQSRRWESLFEEINDYVAKRNKRDLSHVARDRNLTVMEGNLLEAHGWIESLSETYKDEDNSMHENEDHIRRARSLDSTLLSAHNWNQSLLQTSKDEDDGVMKMKLFRLMYESVKDSDLKMKRAELVKADYENSTGFDLGYVCGDAADKLNVMTDISKTLKRMYDVWKPVEHVNAYEQIANLAIEITHLVDMVRMITSPKDTRVLK